MMQGLEAESGHQVCQELTILLHRGMKAQSTLPLQHVILQTRRQTELHSRLHLTLAQLSPPTNTTTSSERKSSDLTLSMPARGMPSHCESFATIISSSCSMDVHEPLSPALPTTSSSTWLTQRLQQPLDLVLRYMKSDCSVLESSFLDELQPMDLLALQADWVDDYCPEEEGIGERKQEGINDKSLVDQKKDSERFPHPGIHSHLDGHNVPA